MSETKPKNCYGNYENDACSWHCVGCMYVTKCKEYQEQLMILRNCMMEDEDEQTE